MEAEGIFTWFITIWLYSRKWGVWQISFTLFLFLPVDSFLFLKKLNMCAMAYNLQEVLHICRYNLWAWGACVARELDGHWTQLPEVNDFGATICAEFCLCAHHIDTSRGNDSVYARQLTSCSSENFPGRRSCLLNIKNSGESLEAHLWGTCRPS